MVLLSCNAYILHSIANIKTGGVAVVAVAAVAIITVIVKSATFDFL